MNKKVTIQVERHADGYVAFPLLVNGVVVGEGDTYEAAVADVKSAIQFHLQTFGSELFDEGSLVCEPFIAERGGNVVEHEFPADASKVRVIKALECLGFQCEREHIAMVRENADGTRTRLLLPNHPRIKASTLRTICTQAGISRAEFLQAYEQT